MESTKDISSLLEKYNTESLECNSSSVNWEGRKYTQDPDLKTILLDFSKDLGGLGMMETIWGDPFLTLSCDVEELKRALVYRCEDLTYEKVINLQVQEYLNHIYISKISSGSCGITSNTIEDILCGENRNKSYLSTKSSKEFANILLEKAKSNCQIWYCRVEAGGHSFQIEFHNNYFSIYQSFMGKYTLSNKIMDEKKYSPEDFVQLIEIALSKNPIDSLTNKPGKINGTSSQNKARIELFHQRALHPNKINYRFFQRNELPEIQTNLRQANERYKNEWQTYLDKPLSDFITNQQSAKQPIPEKISFSEEEMQKIISSKNKLWDEFISTPIKNIDSLEIGNNYTFARYGAVGFIYLGLQEDKYIFELN